MGIPDLPGTEAMVPTGPLTIGGGTASSSPSNTFVQDYGPPFSKETSIVNQESRATATRTTTKKTMGQKAPLKRSAVPRDENSSVYLILPSYAEKHKKEIKQIIATEKLKVCSNKFYDEIFKNVEFNIAYSNRRNVKKLIVRTKL